MEHGPLLRELVIIALLGVAVTALLSRLCFPAVVGLLALGVLLGPLGFGLVSDVEGIEALTEVGVVLLLFAIGLELSLVRLRYIFRQVALGGFIQVASTIAAGFAFSYFFGAPLGQSAFYGFVLALSSTAIVLRALSERSELHAPHGRFIVGMLIFEDLCVVPMVLLLPVLAGPPQPLEVAAEIGLAFGKAALVVVGAIGVARLVVPRVVRFADASRSPEVFLLSVLCLCIGTAWLSSLAGLPLALSAFLGGIVVADSRFQRRGMGDIIPLRDALKSVFFVALGMLFDPGLLLTRPLFIALLLIGFVAGKAALATLAAAIMRFPVRIALLTGIGLGQFSEFGFVLVKLGEAAGLIDRDTASAVLAAGVLSMFATAMLIRLTPHFTAGERLLSPLTRLLGVRGIDQVGRLEQNSGHVVVIGYGIAGRAVVRALTAAGQGSLVLELNAETVRRARADGHPVYYADGTSAEALGHARIQDARMVVVLINDPPTALRIVETVRTLAPTVPILVRTRHLAERERLLARGAGEVVAEEVEANVEVLGRLLRLLEVPWNVITDQIRAMREEIGTGDRRITLPRRTLAEHQRLADLKIDSILIQKNNFAVGRTARALDVRQRTRALIVAVRRGDQLFDPPDPEDAFQAGDIVYLVGSSTAILQTLNLLETGQLG